MYIKREIENKIKKYIKTPEIIAILGPRQSGKTTLLRNIQKQFNNSIYLTFEDQEVLNLFNENIKEFTKIYIKPYDYIIMDEFQYATYGGKQLKFIYDTEEKKKLFISGSSSTDLTLKGISFLVGRVFVFELYPFSFSEFLRYKDYSLFDVLSEYKQQINLFSFKFNDLNISSTLNNKFNQFWEEFILFGGYPRVVISNDTEEKIEVLKNIYNTYFLREIKELLAFNETFKLSTLIKLLAIQIGNLIEFNNLSLNSGFSLHMVKRSLAILQDTYIIDMVKPFFKNKKLEIVKNPKPYFIDTGLRNFVMNNFNTLDVRQDKGSLYENAIHNELLKETIHTNFWRTKSGAEIDFLIENNDSLLPIEIKSKIIKPLVGKSLYNFLLKYPSEQALILNENYLDKIKINDADVLFLPHWII